MIDSAGPDSGAGLGPLRRWPQLTQTPRLPVIHDFEYRLLGRGNGLDLTCLTALAAFTASDWHWRLEGRVLVEPIGLTLRLASESARGSFPRAGAAERWGH